MVYLGQQEVSLNATISVEVAPEAPLQDNDVRFIDYDGTILTSYSASEASTLT